MLLMYEDTPNPRMKLKNWQKIWRGEKSVGVPKPPPPPPIPLSDFSGLVQHHCLHAILKHPIEKILHTPLYVWIQVFFPQFVSILLHAKH